MQYQVNAMGKPCPIPVVETKKVLAQLTAGDTVTVSVDNAIAVQNLLKMAGQKKLAAESHTLASDHYEVVLALTEESLSAAQTPAEEEAPSQEVVSDGREELPADAAAGDAAADAKQK